MKRRPITWAYFNFSSAWRHVPSCACVRAPMAGSQCHVEVTIIASSEDLDYHHYRYSAVVYVFCLVRIRNGLMENQQTCTQHNTA